MNPQDYDLLIIECPSEYTPSKITLNNHETRKERSVNALVTLIQQFEETSIPVRAVDDVCSGSDDKRNAYIQERMQSELQYLGVPEIRQNDRRIKLKKLLEGVKEPRILLTGGFIRVEELPSAGRIKVDGCVGHRAGWLYETIKNFGQSPHIFIDPESGVVDLKKAKYLDLKPDQLYFVESTFLVGDKVKFWNVRAKAV